MNYTCKNILMSMCVVLQNKQSHYLHTDNFKDNTQIHKVVHLFMRTFHIFTLINLICLICKSVIMQTFWLGCEWRYMELSQSLLL